MTTTHDPLDYVRGDTWTIDGTLEDFEGIPLDLEGARVTWKLTTLNGIDVVLSLTSDTGGGILIMDLDTAAVKVVAESEETVDIEPGNYLDWCRVTLSDGSVFTEWTGVIRVADSPQP